MESICQVFYKTGQLSEEDEAVVVDYLYDQGIEVELDESREKLCHIALLKKFGTEEKIMDFLYKDVESLNEKVNLNKFGDLDIASYLNIAMQSDDRTLLTLMNVSKIHNERFKEGFFRKYLELNYPHTVKYKPLLKTYKQYYLKLIYAIDMLKKKYNFEYSPEEDLDVLEIYSGAKKIEKERLNVQSYLAKKRQFA